MIRNDLNFPPFDRHNLFLALAAIGFPLFLLVSPFYGLILLAFLVAFIDELPDRLALLYVCLVMVILIYLRDYGIAWSHEALDDAPRWTSIFLENRQSDIKNIFYNFVQRPSEHELFYWLLFWFLGQGTDSPRLFVIFNITINLLLVVFALRNIYGRFALMIFLGYLLIFPVSLYSLANVYRQQMAFSIFLFAISLILTNRHTRLGNTLLIMTPLFHLSSIIYLALFYIYRFSTNDKQRFLFLILMVVSFYIGTSPDILSSLQFKGIADKIVYYTEHIDRTDRNIKEFGGLLVSLFIFSFARIRGEDNLAAIAYIVAGAILLSTTALHDFPRIVDRILIFVLPLLSIILCRAVLLSLGPALGSMSLLGVFILSTQFPERGHGIFEFLAFGEFFSWLNPLVSLFLSGAQRGI